MAKSRKPEYAIRAARAEGLAQAIAACHPDDARQILCAALIDLSAGMPPNMAFGDVREDARWWSQTAQPVELIEVLSASLRQLGNTALHLVNRKQLFVALFESFPLEDRIAFLRRADPAGQFIGKGGA